MNIVIEHGRLVRDPVITTTASGTSRARFTIAVDRPAKAGEKKQADFINCIAWGKTAEFIAQYFPKGKEILAEGRVQTGSYTDNDGSKHYTTDIVINNVEFCGNKGGENAAADEVPFF